MKSQLFKLTPIFYIATFIYCTLIAISTTTAAEASPSMDGAAREVLKGKEILFIERNQYGRDHHNSATLFQAGEINEAKFEKVAGTSMRILNVDSGTTRTIIDCPNGVVRDPELSFDGKKIIFAMRHNIMDSYSIYEIGIDGNNLKQLTRAKNVSDIDPLYLPDGGIVFGSTRQPKYCMCNRHIMCNLFRMNDDGSNITQIGVSTLFEGHPTLLPDGRILYDRWEYVDRNFSNAQALWTVNPDGTKHSIYYGNNTSAPDGAIDARHIPNTDLIACIFGNCHDRPSGALVVLDRKKGVDGVEPVVKIYPKEARELIGAKPKLTDQFRAITRYYEDPYPINDRYILTSRSIADTLNKVPNGVNSPQALYLIDIDSDAEYMILKGKKSLFDPMIIEPRNKPQAIPSMRNHSDTVGRFYVQNVYIGTHMQGVEAGSVKYLRVIESLEKRSYTASSWRGQGQLAPAINWHNFDAKKVLSDVEVESDGSAHFEAPAGKFLYFQLLDKDKKMIQTMRSGVSLMPGEVNGCIGCHEDRLGIPVPKGSMPMALRKPAAKITGWMGKEPRAFGFMEQVQPILDRNCVSCHDFDPENRKKLVLAGDKNHAFNAAYMNLYVFKIVNLIGAGPQELQKPYTWGTHASRLTKIIDGEHHGVSLSNNEKEVLYTWMDLNGGYYPIYESAFDKTLAGRCPLTNEEMTELGSITGYTYIGKTNLNGSNRMKQSLISFDRPEMSPCLDKIRGDKAKYDRAVELISLGGSRLKQTPRGDIEEEIVMCERHKQQIRRYMERMQGENQNSCNIDTSVKRFDQE